jgi:L-asparagine transporter-like permease
MMTMLPFTGGMATFSRAAFGPYIGYFVGQCELWEYALTIGANMVVVGGSITYVLGTYHRLEPLWWILQLLAFVGVQLVSTKFFFRTCVVMCFVTLAVSVSISWILFNQSFEMGLIM